MTPLMIPTPNPMSLHARDSTSVRTRVRTEGAAYLSVLWGTRGLRQATSVLIASEPAFNHIR